MNVMVGLATVITSKEVTSLGIEPFAKMTARKMLNNPAWDTQCCF